MIVLHGQIMVAGKPQRQVDTGIRTTSLRLQRRQEPSIEWQEEFVVVYFGVWWEMLIEKLSQRNAKLLKTSFLYYTSEDHTAALNRKLMFMGGKGIAILNKVIVEMKYEAMCGQF